MIDNRIVFTSIVGSKLFGADDEESDLDIRGVWVGDPVERREPYRSMGSGDFKVEELRRFLALLLEGDNNRLEVLFGLNPRVQPAFTLVHASRHHFVSREWLRGVGRMALGASRGVTDPQYLAHTLRIVSTAHHAARTGVYEPNLRAQGWDDSRISAYRDLKRRRTTDGGLVRQEILDLSRDLVAYEPTMPEVDVDFVNRLCLYTQLRMWDV